jgi:glycerate 2-kinase
MQSLEDKARHIFFKALEAVDLRRAIETRLKIEGETLFVEDRMIDLLRFKEVVLIGIGKASVTMGAVVEEMLGDRFSRGLLVTNSRASLKLRSEVIVAGHPVPDSRSFEAGRKILDLVRSCREDSLIIMLISGGGSSLVEVPLISEVSLEDIKKLNRILVGCGATIREINIIRKHLSQIKGGRLGSLARDIPCVALYISDVNPGDLQAIASNPLLVDNVTLQDFLSVIEKYDLKSRLPESVARLIRNREVPALPGGHPCATDLHTHILLLDNGDVIKAAATAARNLGLVVETDYDCCEGDYRVVGDYLIGRLLSLRQQHSDKEVCIVSGGEVSCPVRGTGRGGRNQEFVLYCAKRLTELDNAAATVVLSCGTDGIDGNSDAAGAVAGAGLVRRAIAEQADLSGYFQRSDSNAFFSRFGGLIITGPTGNNVRDIRVLIAGPI